jgi:hypothetical protein
VTNYAAFGLPTNNVYTNGGVQRQDFTLAYATWDATNQSVWRLRPPWLTLGRSGVLSWSGIFTLQSATNIFGPYSNLTSVASPYTNTASAHSQLYFRLVNKN